MEMKPYLLILLFVPCRFFFLKKKFKTYKFYLNYHFFPT